MFLTEFNLLPPPPPPPWQLKGGGGGGYKKPLTFEEWGGGEIKTPAIFNRCLFYDLQIVLLGCQKYYQEYVIMASLNTFKNTVYLFLSLLIKSYIKSVFFLFFLLGNLGFH